MSNAAYIQHLLARLHADIDFLTEQGEISPGDARVIRSRLPAAAEPAGSNGHLSRANSTVSSLQALSVNGAPRGPSPSPQPVASTSSPPQISTPVMPQPQAASPIMPELPAKKKVVALWPYHSGTPGDLTFEKGQVIEIVEEANEHWWRGTLDGREGIFPTNHIKVLDPEAAAPGPRAARHAVPPPMPPQQQQKWEQPNGNNQMQPYQGAGPVWQPPQQQEMQIQQQQPPPKHRFGGGGFGNTLAHSAVGGVGFGAGAAIGSGLINSIF